MSKHIYNLKIDKEDKRDHLFKHQYTAPKVLPKSKDLRQWMSDIEDQESLGSCTANAFAGNLEYLYLRQKDPFQASRLFIYYNERYLINEVNNDSGAYLRDGIKALKKWGVCHEAHWPYNIKHFTTKPYKECYKLALQKQIREYLRIRNIVEMKQSLADGYPFVFGITIYESFESSFVSKTGTVPMPRRREAALGGHAMLCVGYDDSNQRFIVRNSWGKGWANKGYCTIPYEYMINEANDLWTVRS